MNFLGENKVEKKRVKELVGGYGFGDLLYCNIGLSFWGGIDPVSGTVIDHTHPLFSQCITGKVFAIPNGRGSCTGSQVVLELMLNDTGPSAIVLRQPDMILALGVIVAQEMFGKSIPIVSVGDEIFEKLSGAKIVVVEGDQILFSGEGDSVSSNRMLKEKKMATLSFSSPDQLLAKSSLTLTPREEDILKGKEGPAKQLALRILSRAAAIKETTELIPILSAHIDATTFIGPGGLLFAEKFVQLGGKVQVPTTLNSSSLDRKKWKELGIPLEFGSSAMALGDAYLKLGCSPSFTCAPYLLPSAPNFGEQIAWGESNAVVFANSVLGARTEKYPDYLDICAALTGLAPNCGSHLEKERVGKVVIDAELLDSRLRRECGDGAFFPLLGYLCGLKSEARVPIIRGVRSECLEKQIERDCEKDCSEESEKEKVNENDKKDGIHKKVSFDNLKAFCAAFGTTASASMFHMVGVTPEAPHLDDALCRSSSSGEPFESILLTEVDLAKVWCALNNGISSLGLNEKKVDSGGSSTKKIEMISDDERKSKEGESEIRDNEEQEEKKESSECDDSIQLVALGNPHLSLTECETLSSVIFQDNRPLHPSVTMCVTMGCDLYSEAKKQGIIDALESFGIQFITDTCWCMLTEPIVPPHCKTLITNSAKYGHYAKALVNRRVRFCDLEGCVEAAKSGKAPPVPQWVLVHSSSFSTKESHWQTDRLVSSSSCGCAGCPSKKNTCANSCSVYEF